MSEDLEVRWDGRLVGTIREPFFEMFNVSGAWVPVAGVDHDLFLAAFAAGGEVTVALGPSGNLLVGAVSDPPDDSIAVSYFFGRAEP